MRKYDICGNCPASWCGRNDDWEYEEGCYFYCEKYELMCFLPHWIKRLILRWLRRKEQTRNRSITKTIPLARIAEIDGITYQEAYKKYVLCK